MMMNNMNNNINNMNPMNNNMISNPSKMDIIMHLMNQNSYMQNQIEINNQLIFRLFQDYFQMPINNNLFHNNNQNLQAINNFNMQNNFNNNNNNFDRSSPIIPRGNFLNIRSENNGLNILFNASTGLKIAMDVPRNIKVSELLSRFMNKIKLDENLIDKNIFFIFNGVLLKKNDKRNISELGIKQNSIITIVDAGNLLGKI